MAYFTHEIAVEFNEWKRTFYDPESRFAMFSATKTLQLDCEPPSGWEPIVFLEVAEEAYYFKVMHITYKYVTSTQLAITIDITKQYSSDVVVGLARVLKQDSVLNSSCRGRVVLRARLGFNPTEDFAQKLNTVIDDIQAMKAMHAELIQMVMKHLIKQ